MIIDYICILIIIYSSKNLKIKISSVRPAETFWRNIIFLASFQDKCLKFFEEIPLTNEHLIYNYVVPLSVGYSFATICVHVLVPAYFHLD